MNPSFLGERVYTKQNLIDNVLAPNGFDGIRSQHEVAQIASEVESRKFAR